MLMASHTEISPWTIIKSDNKKDARLNCIKHILSRVQYTNKIHEDFMKIDKKILCDGREAIENMEEQHKFAKATQ